MAPFRTRGDAVHYRVVCDACGKDAELCAKRHKDGQRVKEAMAESFRRLGWHHDVDSYRTRDMPMARREGMGKWYCPGCGRYPPGLR